MTLLTSRIWQNPNIFRPKLRFQNKYYVICKKESYIHDLVLLNLLNSLRNRDKMLRKPKFYLVSPTRLIKSSTHVRSSMYFEEPSGSVARAIDWESKGCYFENQRSNCVVSLDQTLYPMLQSRKGHNMTEKLLTST